LLVAKPASGFDWIGWMAATGSPLFVMMKV
jgi:hypothetical protein